MLMVRAPTLAVSSGDSSSVVLSPGSDGSRPNQDIRPSIPNCALGLARCFGRHRAYA
jgi:hypothetical protein